MISKKQIKKAVETSSNLEELSLKKAKKDKELIKLLKQSQVDELASHLTLNQEVEGSNPSLRTKGC